MKMTFLYQTIRQHRCWLWLLDTKCVGDSFGCWSRWRFRAKTFGRSGCQNSKNVTKIEKLTFWIASHLHWQFSWSLFQIFPKLKFDFSMLAGLVLWFCSVVLNGPSLCLKYSYSKDSDWLEKMLERHQVAPSSWTIKWRHQVEIMLKTFNL